MITANDERKNMNEYLLYKDLLTPFITIEDADSNITELYAAFGRAKRKRS